MLKSITSAAFFCHLLCLTAIAQTQPAAGSAASDYALLPEQAAYDVKSYDLDLRLDIPNESLKGVLTAKAMVKSPLAKFVLDLDTPLTANSVAMADGKKQLPLAFERKGNRIWITFPKTQPAGKMVELRVSYGGKPRVAKNPPWDGGFTWKKTADGSPWIAVTCEGEGEGEGPVVWFPAKDQPTDEAETVSLHFTVPKNLVAAGNGKLQSVVENEDGTHTFNWFVSQPINNYNITIAVAPYKVIEDEVKSVSGMMIPIKFYVLPEHYEQGKTLVALQKKYLEFDEKYLGPFPFRADKIGIVETPHLGMEHQSLIAYGNRFRYNKNGHDWLLFHEFGHEWFGNLVTASDWRDLWIHEGFQSFMDTLYLEKTVGREAYIASMANRYKNLHNTKAVAPRDPGATTDDGDIYDKGALILSTLRYYIGDDAFFRSLRRMTYPDPKMEKVTDGTQTRFATTDDFMRIAERESGKDLGWFFELYFRQPALPKLSTSVNGNVLELKWETPNNMPFPMPIDVKIGNETRRVEMPGGNGTVKLPQGAVYTIDPESWVLRAK